jgi:hypothetical protein
MMELPIMRYIFALFMLFSVAARSSSLADPDIQWKLIRLPHFDLIYDAKHQELAEAYAQHLEEIVQTLRGSFSAVPEKTLLVLNDRTDLTNGYATAIPVSTIVAFPVLPGPLESIYEHGNWPRELIMHEYTHILSFEPQRGVVKVLRSVFGSIITPTLFLPRWWLEGIAVEMETRHSHFGRLRSVSQDAALRSFAVDKTLSNVTIDEINESAIPTWPSGARPYLFGSLMWSQMLSLRQEKPGVVDELHQRYGGRFPFLLDGPAYSSFDMSYDGVFESMITDLERRLESQLSRLQTISPSATDPYQVDEPEAFHPSVSSDGLRMAYLVKDAANKRSVRVIVRPSLSVRFSDSQKSDELGQDLNEDAGSLRTIPGKAKEENHDGPPTGTISRLAWFPKSKKLIYDKVNEVTRFQEVSDLWIYDLKDKKSTKITTALRAREASVSPNEENAVFVKLGAGSTSLGLWDFAKGTWTLIYTPPLLSTVSFPTFLNQDEVVFGERTKEGLEGLKKIHLGTREVTSILSGYKNAKIPLLSPWGLTFLSAKNGVSNLYLASSDLNSARPLTHSLTSVGPSSVDPQNEEIYFTTLTSKGQQIAVLPKTEWQRVQPLTLPAVESLFADRYPAHALESPSTPENQTKYEVEDYSPASHLWPRYWIPSFVFGSDGAFVSASTSQADPVGLHSYSGTVAYDSGTRRGIYNLIYNNATTPALISLGAYDYRTLLALSSYELRLQTQKIIANWQPQPLSTDWSALLGWTWNQRELLATKLSQSGPAVGVQYANYSQSGAQISPETGNGFSLVNTSYLRDRIHEGFNEVRYSFVQYWSKWLPTRHAIMAKVQGRWIEDRVSLTNYESSLAYPLFLDSLNAQYLMRGYASGTFLFKTVANYALEYRFPIASVYRGRSTAPVFLKQIHGALVADGIQTDGYSYNPDLKGISNFPFETTPPWKVFSNAGGELKFDLTLGFHFPLTVYLGAYWPLDKRPAAGTNPNYALGLLL